MASLEKLSVAHLASPRAVLQVSGLHVWNKDDLDDYKKSQAQASKNIWRRVQDFLDLRERDVTWPITVMYNCFTAAAVGLLVLLVSLALEKSVGPLAHLSYDMGMMIFVSSVILGISALGFSAIESYIPIRFGIWVHSDLTMSKAVLPAHALEAYEKADALFPLSLYPKRRFSIDELRDIETHGLLDPILYLTVEDRATGQMEKIAFCVWDANGNEVLPPKQ